MKTKLQIPLIAFRDGVMFPLMEIPLMIKRDFSIKGVQYALASTDGRVAVVAQKSVEDEELSPGSSLYSVGMVCKIEQEITLSDGGMKIQIRGERALSVNSIEEVKGFWMVTGEQLCETSDVTAVKSKERDEIVRLIVRLFELRIPKLSKDEHQLLLKRLNSEMDLSKFTQFVRTLLPLPNEALSKEKGIGALKKGIYKGMPTKVLNARVAKRQQLLEEMNPTVQIKLIKEILADI